MADPVNPARAGETWDPLRISVMEAEIAKLKDLVVVSGGWAWHYLSPAGHTEFKMTHDHKDIDLFVAPADVPLLLTRIKARGYKRIWTRFDGKTEGFSRYEKVITEDVCCGVKVPVKVIIDLFVEAVPSIEANHGVRVVEPATLLSYYGQKHASLYCHAVRAAREIVAAGGTVLNNLALAPTEDKR